MDAASARYSRQRALSGFGLTGQQQLAAARVLVIGAGGLGSSILPTLAAAGVGEISVVDDDVIDESNLHRQTLYTLPDAGRLKVVAAAEVLHTLSPDATVVSHPVRFDSETATSLTQDVDLIVDASDTIATRYVANDAAANRGVPLVWGNALGWTGQAGVAWDAHGVDYRDLFPTESTSADASCALVGVLPSVCAVIGGIMANEVLKLLTDSGEPLVGRVVHFDARSGRFRELSYRRPPGPRRASAMSEIDETSTVTPLQLKALLDDRDSLTLLDVREPWEADRAQIPGSVLIPLGELASRRRELDQAADIVIYCHRGSRSAQAVDYLHQIGFDNVRQLRGGIDAWSRNIDPAVSRY